jgi:demethylmenaquinone methyltransferase/2-methoxy-6-polyprenyl-1,4-benzoquinol methylase
MDRARGAAPENRYYSPGEERAEGVHRLFSRIARRYDRINDLMSLGLHRRWKRRLALLASPRPGERALDLCCGTGDVARDLAISVKDGVPLEVVGLDFTQEMLEIARTLTPQGVAITYRQGDALHLPFADASFDIVTCAYGLRNLADLDQGLKEAMRVLRPGGRLASLEFGRPHAAIHRGLYYAYLKLALPLYGWIYFRDPQAYGYIFTSVSRFPGQHELAERMRRAGFSRIEVQDLMLGSMGICIAHRGATASG